MSERVAWTLIEGPPGERWVVSTVRLPFTHIGGDYETLVFPATVEGEVASWAELAMRRYETVEAAHAGHEAMVAEWETKGAADVD